MYSLNHIIWIVISLGLVAFGLCYLLKHKPPLRKVLTWAVVVCAVSELIKTLSVLEMVPTSDGTGMNMYLEMQHVPLHLCSIQILFICYTCFAKDGKIRDAILAFMYPTCTIGATFPLFIPTVFTESVEPAQAFTHPMPYQFFLYHVMLIILGIYIYHSGAVDLRPKHYLSTMGILGGLAFLSFYLNSIFASPTYQNGELVSVDYTTNFFFTHHPPIDIPLTQEWHWFLYVGILIVLAFLLIALFYIPVFRRAKKK
ncbi:MAG: YwaF family protein [Clostridia bacterium]|nr:YwaF family protein [Clostridia bacterium]